MSTRNVAHAGLLGVAIFGTAGLFEACLWSTFAQQPDPFVLLRRSVVGYVALGLGVGLAFGLALELLDRRGLRDRRRLLVGGLLLGLLAFEAVVYTQVALRAAGVRSVSAPSLLSTGVVLGLAGGMLVLLWIRARRPADAPAPLPARPARWAVPAALLVAVALLPAVLPAAGPSAAGPPNVLLIVMDTTRFDRLSLHGYELDTTPQLDRIAAEGAAFERAYSASPWTLPSHVSMLTGLHPSIHGATSEHTFMDEGAPTLATRLGEQGLRSVAITRKSWLSNETGFFRDFDEAYDLYNPPRLPALFELERIARRPRSARPPDKGAVRVTSTAIEWLARWGGEPFFMLLNYNEAHNDLFPPSPFRERFLGEYRDTSWGRDRFPDMIAAELGEETYSEEDLEILNRLYDASVAYQDMRMGQLFQFLREQEFLDRTLVIVTADHGENLGDHGMVGHNLSMADTLIHVPLVVRYPARVPGGLRVDALVETRRIGSLAELVVSEPDSKASLDTQALVAALSERPDRAVLSEVFRPRVGDLETLPDDPRFHRIRKSIVLDHLKYVWSSDGADELYDLRRDPGELDNLVAQRPEARDRLRELLLAESQLWEDVEGSEELELSEEMRERLRAMGYLR